MGNFATSRAEGQHGAIKKWITVSTGDLTDVYRRVMLSVEQQQVEIRRQIGYEQANTLISHYGHIWGAVQRKVSHHALRLVHEELRKAQDQADVPTPCTGVFTATMGLPCSHRIRDTLAIRGRFELTDFFAHWWIDPPQILSLMNIARTNLRYYRWILHCCRLSSATKIFHTTNSASCKIKFFRFPRISYCPQFRNRLPFVAGEVIPGDTSGSFHQLSVTQVHSRTPSARWLKQRGNLVVRRVEEVAAGVGVAEGAGKAL
ncbi:hypothetical protein PsorP6_014977 [Peronosclerospora sorghi]|uniref:Uncharacterized protein n=1 Tax=Peronosclerospora sorghi TaxID=230839 RepID=A0ACC0VS56_9STRA|nr:hypothetical protein PsorP6_014977 [Peronosclerospora sorghi]